MEEQTETCPTCGEPLERADDFWYCDNPGCPRRDTSREPAERDSPAPPPEER